LPDRERELEREAALDAQVGKIMAVRRQLITDLDAVEDRLARLGHDLRRLQPFPPSHRGQGGRRLISRVVGAVVQQRRRLDFEDVSASVKGAEKEKFVDRKILLCAFVDTVWFVQETRGVLTFCERCVAKWNLAPERGRQWLGEVSTALVRFFPTTRVGGCEVDGGRERASEERILRRLMDEVEGPPLRVEDSLRWKNYSTCY
jgi:hypothetical protein